MRMDEPQEEKNRGDPSEETLCCDISDLDVKGKRSIIIKARGDCDSPDLRENILKQVNVALKGRDNVVMTRLNDETQSKLDALVEIELFKSRSEAAAFFISEGINSRQDLFDKVMPTMEQIKKLKEELKLSID